MSSEYDWLLVSDGRTGDAQSLLRLGAKLEVDGKVHLAATAYDRAFGLSPDSTAVIEARKNLLDGLSVVEHGIRFRYVPGGTFFMGSDDGEPDEHPPHPVQLSHYWLSDTPLSWAAFCDLMQWSAPPYGRPGDDMQFQGDGGEASSFHLLEENKVRLQYCEDATVHAGDWHAHAGIGALFAEPAREDPRRPWRYDRKPMIGISWQDAELLCRNLSDSKTTCRLPTEAEWEKAARGGLIGKRYPWGDDPPSDTLCDYNRFDEFSILPMRRFAPNRYGLYAMNGCVWEWTSDWYDSEYYASNSTFDPKGPEEGTEKVLRGGSWADCPEVVTVSFRMSRPSASWREGRFGPQLSPTIGFRICRTDRA